MKQYDRLTYESFPSFTTNINHFFTIYCCNSQRHKLILGNWNGQVTFKLTFGKGGCIDFGMALLKAVDMGLFFA